MKRVVIVTGSALCHNPRVWKEASALAAHFEVEVLGAWFDADLKSQDLALLRSSPFRFTPVLDATRQRLPWLASRLRVKAARWWLRLAQRECVGLLGYTAGALLSHARRRQADLFIAHSEPALWACSRLLARGARVGMDVEDWFSEDLLPEARAGRPLRMLRRMESEVLRGAVHAACPSQALSVALALEYGCRPPAVIYNAFPWSDRLALDGEIKDRKNPGVPSIHWYSQTLGPGRGLEELLAALPNVQTEAELHLRGQPAGGFYAWLLAQLPETWRPRVFVHGLVSNAELLSRIAEHDIGFAGEQKYCRSRDFTITNKILHYLLGGLAVVASDTAGQREVASCAGQAVRLYRTGDAAGLAQSLDALLVNRTLLDRTKHAALHAARQVFCWEQQVPKLLASVHEAMS